MKKSKDKLNEKKWSKRFLKELKRSPIESNRRIATQCWSSNQYEDEDYTNGTICIGGEYCSYSGDSGEIYTLCEYLSEVMHWSFIEGVNALHDYNYVGPDLTRTNIVRWIRGEFQVLENKVASWEWL